MPPIEWLSDGTKFELPQCTIAMAPSIIATTTTPARRHLHHALDALEEVRLEGGLGVVPEPHS